MKHLRRLALACGSILTVLIILELSCRYYYYLWNSGRHVPFVLFSRSYGRQDDGVRIAVQPSPLPGILYELRPNFGFEFFSIPLKTNSAGLIGDEEFSFEKPPGTIRIAGVGDSYMFPWDVTLEKTYLSLLKKRIASEFPDKRIEVMNFSVPGYNTAIEYEVIRQKVLPYHPDFIILGFCGNDMDIPNYVRREVKAISYAWFVIKHAYAYASCSVAHTACSTAFADFLTDEPANANGDFTHQPGEVPAQYRSMVGVDNYRRYMKLISEITIQKNVPVVMTTRGDDEIIGLKSELEGLGYLIVWGDATVQVERFRISQDDPHYTARGHRILSDALYTFLIDNPAIHRIFYSNDQ